MSPVIYDETGQPIGLVARLKDGRIKARALRGWPVRKPRYFEARKDAEAWIHTVAGYHLELAR